MSAGGAGRGRGGLTPWNHGRRRAQDRSRSREIAGDCGRFWEIEQGGRRLWEIERGGGDRGRLNEVGRSLREIQRGRGRLWEIERSGRRFSTPSPACLTIQLTSSSTPKGSSSTSTTLATTDMAVALTRLGKSSWTRAIASNWRCDRRPPVR